MAKKSKVVKEKAPRKDPRIEEIYEEVVEFICPVRGKVKQKVKIKRYKSLQEIEEKRLVSSSDAIAKLEEVDNGLDIFGEGEVLETEPAPTEENDA